MEDAINIEKDFLEEEVSNAIKDLGKEKAPGEMALYCSFATLLGHVKGDMMCFFMGFHARGFFQKSLIPPF